MLLVDFGGFQAIYAYSAKLLFADNEHAETQHAWLSLMLRPSLVAAPSNRTPHTATHLCDTLQAWTVTTTLIHNIQRQ